MTDQSLSDTSGASPLVPEDPQQPSSPSAVPKRTQACQRCWKRKQRCDRKLPSCTTCQRYGFECLARTLPPKQSFEDAGLTHSSFHSYMEALARNVASQDSPNSQASSQNSWPAAPRPLSMSPSRAPEPTPDVDASTSLDGSGGAALQSLPVATSGSSDEEDPSVGDTMGAIGLLASRAMADSRAEPASDQFTEKLNLQHMIHAALAIDGHDPSASRPSGPGSGHLHAHAFSAPFQCDLPPRNENVEYLQRYLESTYYIPCLARQDETTLFAHLDHILAAIWSQRQNENDQTNNGPSPTRLFEIYMQIAIGIMVSADAVRMTNYSLGLHSAATRLLPAVFKSKQYADSIRCLLLLIAYSLVHPQGGSMWHLLGWAIRMCITAGFHKEPTSQTGLPSEDIEEARWLFWSVYVLDRWVSIAMDRPFGIQDGDISIQIPGEHLEEPPPGTSLCSSRQAREALSLQFIRHAHLISHIRTNYQVNVMAHYGGLAYWRDLGAPPGTPPDMIRAWKENVDQLACRTLLQIVLLLEEQEPTQASEIPSGMVRVIKDDTKASCCQFIRVLYDRAGQGQTVGSFLNAYDLIAATIVYICLGFRQTMASVTGFGNQGSSTAELTEVVHKASVLVTQIASRFPAFEGFHRVFLTLSSKAMGDQSAGMLNEYPRALPSPLIRFIGATFPQESRVTEASKK